MILFMHGKNGKNVLIVGVREVKTGYVIAVVVAVLKPAMIVFFSIIVLVRIVI